MTMRKIDVEQVRDALPTWVLVPYGGPGGVTIPIRALCDLALKSFDEPARGCAHPRLSVVCSYETGSPVYWSRCDACGERMLGDLVRERFIRGIPNGGGR